MIKQSTYRLQELADYIGAELEGDADVIISGLATLQTATNQELAFYTNSHYKKYLSTTTAACVLLNKLDKDKFQGHKLITEDPYLAYAQLTQLFAPKPARLGSIHETAIVGDNVTLGEGVTVGPHVVIESGCNIGDGSHIYPGCYIGVGTQVGSNTTVYPNATIYHSVALGDDCIIHSSSVIGSDGFGFAPSKEGWQKIHQLGGVRIGHRVEIGAGTTIDRGALEDTVIDDGVKIDNQVQIAHNVHIGEGTAIAAAVAIAGSTIIGKRCTIAGAVGIVGHLSIVDDVHITAMTMITKSITAAGSYSSGVPMNTTREWRKNAVRFNQLDAIAKQLKSIKK